MMKHLFRQGSASSAPTFVVFHGTGGTELDLLPLAERIDPTASVLSLRGNVLENGMSRFFRRLAEGVFDEEDLIFRTQELKLLLDHAAVEYGFDRQRTVALGYSNGANIAASMLFLEQDAWQGAILHHPMVPLRGRKLPDLTGIPVFIGAGRNDPICSPRETNELQTLLEEAGAEVTVHWEYNGHCLTASEVEAAAQWYREHTIN